MTPFSGFSATNWAFEVYCVHVHSLRRSSRRSRPVNFKLHHYRTHYQSRGTVTADKWWQMKRRHEAVQLLVGSFGRRTMASIKRSLAMNVDANEVELMSGSEPAPRQEQRLVTTASRIACVRIRGEPQLVRHSTDRGRLCSRLARTRLLSFALRVSVHGLRRLESLPFGLY